MACGATELEVLAARIKFCAAHQRGDRPPLRVPLPRVPRAPLPGRACSSDVRTDLTALEAARRRGRARRERPGRAEFVTVTGVVQGVGLPALRLRPRAAARRARLGAQHVGRGRGPRRGRRPRCSTPSRAACARRRRRAPTSPSLTRAAAPFEGHDGFVIVESAPDPDAYQLVSPDIATCDDCRRELLDPADRRSRLPVHQLHELRAAVHDHRGPALRPRAHDDAPLPAVSRLPRGVRGPDRPALPRRAQRLPGLRAAGAAGAAGGRRRRGPATRAAPSSWPPAAKRTRRRRSAPPPSCCAPARSSPSRGSAASTSPATRPTARVVRRLKERKRRPDKPLAVMFRDLDELRAHCRVSDEEAALLTSPEHPIVLLEWREIDEDGTVGAEVGGAGGDGDAAGDGCRRGEAGDAPRAVDPEVAVGQRYLGAMLPYTPLHVLLLRAAGASARHDQRQPRRGADRQGLGGGRQAGAHRRRLPSARPRDRGALRRLGGARATRTAAPGPALAGLRALPGRAAACASSGPRLWRRAQEHVLRDARRLRLPQPAHRRPREPRDARALRDEHRRSTSGCSGSSRRSSPTTCTRSTWRPSTR